ncbi:MAG: DUF1353 domain-containing protein [Burkholderiaceae bacterium]|nr:DUF1353 domain-containing protein [Burkholderiaceae bacterium]
MQSKIGLRLVGIAFVLMQFFSWTANAQDTGKVSLKEQRDKAREWIERFKQKTSMMMVPGAAVRPDAVNKHWILLEDVRYQIGATDDLIVVPAGFVTDYASIPSVLWSFGLSPHGLYSRAADIHDYLYWTQLCTREQADRLLVIAMKESDVGKFDEWAIYTGVDRGGKSSWSANAKERSAGWPRIVPEMYRRPPPNKVWADYRKELKNAGVRDPAFAESPTYCKYGNSTDVPGLQGKDLKVKDSVAGNASIVPADFYLGPERVVRVKK